MFKGVGTLLTYWLDGRDEAMASARTNPAAGSDHDEHHDENAFPDTTH